MQLLKSLTVISSFMPRDYKYHERKNAVSRVMSNPMERARCKYGLRYDRRRKSKLRRGI